MSDPIALLVLGAIILLAVTLAGTAMLVAWRGWLDLKRLELAARGSSGRPAGSVAAARIELADLRERVRRLEAIANGTEI